MTHMANVWGSRITPDKAKADYRRVPFKCRRRFCRPLDDYKFMCINGSPVVINAIGERDIKHHTFLDQYYNLDMELLPWEKQQCGKTVRKPKRLKEMVDLANKLAKPFPFVRVDLYDTSTRYSFW